MAQAEDGGLSPEAQQFLKRAIADALTNAGALSDPIDFSRIDQIRAETADAYQPASRRAIEKHDLTIETTDVGGVVCDRIRSRRRPSPDRDNTLFYVFGGAFIQGSPFEDLPIIGSLAEHTGLTVVAPRYRLAPEHRAPAAFDDVVAAYDGMVNLGHAPVALAGESAGGNLALLLAQYVRDSGGPAPKVLALLSPAADLRTDPALFQPTFESDPLLQHQRVYDVARTYMADHSPDEPSVSPIFGELRGLPPVFISTGSRDLLLAMCLRLNRKLRRAGVEVVCQVWDGLWHVFEFYDDYPEQAESLIEIANFINWKLDDQDEPGSGAT